MGTSEYQMHLRRYSLEFYDFISGTFLLLENHIKCSEMKMLAFSQHVGNEIHETLILWFYLCDSFGLRDSTAWKTFRENHTRRT